MGLGIDSSDRYYTEVTSVHMIKHFPMPTFRSHFAEYTFPHYGKARKGQKYWRRLYHCSDRCRSATLKTHRRFEYWSQQWYSYLNKWDIVSQKLRWLWGFETLVPTRIWWLVLRNGSTFACASSGISAVASCPNWAWELFHIFGRKLDKALKLPGIERSKTE